MGEKAKILIVDDEKPLRETMARWFRRDYECLLAHNSSSALEAIETTPDLALMISDVRMPDGDDGVTLMRKARELRPELSIIMLTAYGTVQLAVDSMRNGGADDFYQKPITDLPAFEQVVAKAVEKASLRAEVASLKAESNAELENFTGKSPAMEKVYRLIRKIAPAQANVLIEGPSGTGKELVARAIHNLSPRAKGPFVAVECSAFSQDLLQSELFGYMPGTFTGGLREGKMGCFESAEGGTIFLDEIGEIDLPTQTALLRVLENKAVRRMGGGAEVKIDFRLVSATNRNLAQLVSEGKFREDLYYRLNVVDIQMPALKDRPGDIARLTARFLKEFAAQYHSEVSGIEPEAMKRLEDYNWPGNVRQLRNVVEKMVVLAGGKRLTLDDLPVEVATPPMVTAPAPAVVTMPQVAVAPMPAGSLAETERQQILAAIAAAGGNKSKAALRLGISRRTLHRKLKQWGISQ